MKYRLYEVGGRIRDYYLGVESKDVDYSVVIELRELYDTPFRAFYAFLEQIKQEGFDVKTYNPDTFTIRAMFPKEHKHSGVADFVLSRKELQYLEGSRIPLVELGTLFDDLIRRDFTVNAMARDENGTVYDFFGGQRDLIDRILRTPKDASTAFRNDPLRILRAIRFSIIKDLSLSEEIIEAIKSFRATHFKKVSQDRTREEFVKMFKHNTIHTLAYLKWLEEVNSSLYFTIMDSFWLLPTNKQ